MRILTVRQPWAAAIIHPSINPTKGAMRVKDVENRTTNTRATLAKLVADQAERVAVDAAFWSIVCQVSPDTRRDDFEAVA